GILRLDPQAVANTLPRGGERPVAVHDGLRLRRRAGGEEDGGEGGRRHAGLDRVEEGALRLRAPLVPALGRTRVASASAAPRRQPAGGGDRNAIALYDFPRQRVIHHFVQDMPIRVSALRTLGAYANVFALESFMDELAAAAGADPIAFRLAHLNDQRARAVIEAVAKKAGWAPGRKSDGPRGP